MLHRGVWSVGASLHAIPAGKGRGRRFLHKSNGFWVVVLTLGLLVIACGTQQRSALLQPETLPPKQPAGAKTNPQLSYATLPLAFEANQGQTDERVNFLARGRGYTMFLTSTEAVLSMPQAPKEQAGQARIGLSATLQTFFSALPSSQPPTVLRMQLLGANANPQVAGLEEMPSKSNYFTSNDPRRWRTNVPNFAKIKYQAVYPGVDLVYYGNQRQLEYDFVVAPGADPQAIVLGFQGMDKLSVDTNGALVLSIAGGEVSLLQPRIYQETDGDKYSISGRYVLLDPDSQDSRSGIQKVSFAIDTYDRSKPLVIDPVLVYSTFMGGSSGEAGLTIAADNVGNTYVAGETSSSTFPTANASQNELGNGFPSQDAFIAKFDPTGQVVFSTYLGGSDSDTTTDLAIDGSGNAYIRGRTTSASDFPLVNASFRSTDCAENGDCAFITKFNPQGQVVYSTFLGKLVSSSLTIGRSLAVDYSGNAYVTGVTASPNFPVVKAFQGALGGGEDAFVTKLDPIGQAIYSTYLGAEEGDSGFDIATDGAGNAYVTGNTHSSHFPLVNAAYGTHGDDGSLGDAFVTKFDSTGAVIYSTFLGGSGTDQTYSIAADSTGNAAVTGSTDSPNFPLLNAFDDSFTSNCVFSRCLEGFVTKFDPTGQIVFSTYLGGSKDDFGYSILEDNAGATYVIGYTQSTDLPVINAFNVNNTDGGDLFVAKFNLIGQTLYSSYVGGFGKNPYNFGFSPAGGFNLALDGSGNAYITGYVGGTDALALKLDPSGQPIYSTSVGGSDIDFGLAIAADNAGNAYITGVTQSVDFPTKNAFQSNLVCCPSSQGTAGDVFVVKIGDAAPPAPDADGDSIPDASDNCPAIANSDQKDTDGDGVGDACDNCVSVANPDQTDSNGNGVGNVCEPSILTVTPDPLDFGTITIGTSKDLNLTIQNTGGGTLTGSCTTAAPFSLPNGCSFSIPMGQLQQVTVRFSPTDTSTFTGSADIISNSTSSPVSVSLTGSGSLPPPSPFSSPLTATPKCWPGDSQFPAGPGIQLNWGAASGATSYDIYRAGSLIQANVNGTSFWNITGLIAGQSYTYQVKAKNLSGVRNSNSVMVNAPSKCKGSGGALTPVVLIHGFLGNPSSFGEMKSFLEKDAGYTGKVFEYDYSSLTSCSSPSFNIEQIAGDFWRWLGSSQGPGRDKKVDVVAHSMGGLVVRAYMTGMALAADGSQLPYGNEIQRLILAGTPNYGVLAGQWASLAKLICEFRGEGVGDGLVTQGKEMAYGSLFLWNLDQKWLEKKPLTPKNVLIIAGTNGNTSGDGLVEIASAALPEDFKLPSENILYVPFRHCSFENICGDTDLPALVNVQENTKQYTYMIVRNFLLFGKPPSPVPYQPSTQALDDSLFLIRIVDKDTKLPSASLPPVKIDCSPFIISPLPPVITNEASNAATVTIPGIQPSSWACKVILQTTLSYVGVSLRPKFTSGIPVVRLVELSRRPDVPH